MATIFWPCSPHYLARSSVASQSTPSKRILALGSAQPAPQFKGEKAAKL
jgi:hypothetical protein